MSATVACRDETIKSQLLDDPNMNQDLLVEFHDLSQHLPAGKIEKGKYDLVLAPDLSFFESEPELVLKNMTNIMKDGGKLCIAVTNDLLDHYTAFFDAMPTKRTIFHSSEAAQASQSSLLIVEKTEVYTNGVNESSEPERITLINAADRSESAQMLTRELSYSLEQHGYATASFVWGSDVSKLAGQSCMSLLELERPLLRDLSEKDFTYIKKIILDTSSLFWVTGIDDPESAMIDGLARVVRNEIPGLLLRTFHSENSSLAPAAPLAESISRAFASKTQDDEFRVKDDLLQTSRIEEDTDLNKQISNLLPDAPEIISSMPLGRAGDPLKLCVQSPGILDSICMKVDESAETALETDSIEIRVKATALKYV